MRECSYSSARVPIDVYISFVDEAMLLAREVDRVEVVVVEPAVFWWTSYLPFASGVSDTV